MLFRLGCICHGFVWQLLLTWLYEGGLLLLVLPDGLCDLLFLKGWYNIDIWVLGLLF